jgi:hypothetical protein
MKWQKRSSFKKIVKRDHLWVVARLARRHVARAAWANDGKGVPPTPNPACFLAGDAVDGRQPKWAMPQMPTLAGPRGWLPP